MNENPNDGMFELKFPLTAHQVEHAIGWMRGTLRPDPHGTGDHADTYLVQSLYLDTPTFDVFHRKASFGRAKFRIRRYGEAPTVYLERKLKRAGAVRKRRVGVSPAELPQLHAAANGARWAGAWFHHRLTLRALRPVVLMSYSRIARLGSGTDGAFRVTLDRDLRASAVDEFVVPRQPAGDDLLCGGAVLEVKFARALPACVKTFVETRGLLGGGFSKYRRGASFCGLVLESTLGDVEENEAR